MVNVGYWILWLEGPRTTPFSSAPGPAIVAFLEDGPSSELGCWLRRVFSTREIHTMIAVLFTVVAVLFLGVLIFVGKLFARRLSMDLPRVFPVLANARTQSAAEWGCRWLGFRAAIISGAAITGALILLAAAVGWFRQPTAVFWVTGGLLLTGSTALELSSLCASQRTRNELSRGSPERSGMAGLVHAQVVSFFAEILVFCVAGGVLWMGWLNRADAASQTGPSPENDARIELPSEQPPGAAVQSASPMLKSVAAPEGEPATSQSESSGQEDEPSPSISEAPEVRMWTDSTGKFNVRAKLISVLDGKVKLEKEDGRIIELPIQRLSEADQQLVRSSSP